MISISSHNKYLPLGIVIGLTLAVAFSLLAFTEPTQAPPGCTAGTPGCDAPLNIGTAGQSKNGWLRATKSFVGDPPTVSEQDAVITGNGYFRTSGGVILNSGGASTGLIVQNGNVGIGTVNPQAPLMVKTSAGAETGGSKVLELQALHTAGASAGSGVRIDFTDSSAGSLVAQIRTQHEATSAKIGMSFHTLDGSMGERVRILSNGNVGIGTTNPVSGSGSVALHIRGANPDLRLERSSTGRTWEIENNENFYLYDRTAGQARLAVDTSGNVGIGTAGPEAKLDVQGGRIKVKGIYFDHVTGSNPSCPAGISLQKKWNPKTCGSGTCACTTSSGWIIGNTPQCGYYTAWDPTFGCYAPATCYGDSWTEAVCLGN